MIVSGNVRGGSDRNGSASLRWVGNRTALLVFARKTRLEIRIANPIAHMMNVISSTVA